MNEILKIILSISVSGGLAALILFALKPLYKNRLKKSWQYYIWLVVLMRMLLPFTPEVSLIALFSLNEQAFEAEEEQAAALYDFSEDGTFGGIYKPAESTETQTPFTHPET
ncbi:MAG: M56 family metallopeptidase, partial [Oscillospiraceae bacterium]|nr:M56 family metallopeptidase [Oscillospiraceae bacterium]